MDKITLITLFNTVLVCVLTFVFGYVCKYFAELIKETKEFKKIVLDINKRHIKESGEIFQNAKSISEAIHDLQTLRKNLDKELNNIQRTLAEGNMGLNEWRKEASKVRENDKRNQRELEKIIQIIFNGIKVLKRHEKLHENTKSNIVRINKDIFIIKSKKPK